LTKYIKSIIRGRTGIGVLQKVSSDGACTGKKNVSIPLSIMKFQRAKLTRLMRMFGEVAPEFHPPVAAPAKNDLQSNQMTPTNSTLLNHFTPPTGL